ncbi:MAG: cupin domain-containing protein [Acidobacteriota bacterium]
MTPRHTPTHRPDDELLAAFAAGQLPLCQRVVLEAHLALCDVSRSRVAELQNPGGDWLRSLPEEPSPDRLWRALEQRLTPPTQATAEAEDPFAGVPLPAAARLELPPRSQPLEWSSLPGSYSRTAPLATDPADDLQLLLVMTPPEKRFPWHRHLGGEDLLILAGGLNDATGHYLPGDFVHYPAGTEHAPWMDPGEPCWAIACIAGGVDFQGP